MYGPAARCKRFFASTWPRDHFCPQHDGAARIVAYDVERVLADIDADHGDRGIGCLRHGALLVFGAPCQLSLLAGREHGRTIPLAEVERASQQSEAMKIDAAGEMFSLSARHLSEWRGPHPDLVGGFERDSAPIQKQAEHIEPADHKHDLARNRLTVLI